MTSLEKQSNWNGKNKHLVRSKKFQLITQDQREGLLPAVPNVLTFAGAKAHLERAMVARGVTTATNIITVQSYRKFSKDHDGDAVLRELIKVRNKKLPGMYIWPHEFHSFVDGYTSDKIFIPAFSKNSGNPKWYLDELFKKEMFNFIKHPPVIFDVLDIDFCGIFSEDNAGDVANLMQSKALSNSGLLFINHQKGRDCRRGKLFNFLREYFNNCSYFDINTVADLNLASEDAESLWITRYILVPVFYIIEAYKAGYQLQVDRLVEYKDRNKYSGVGVNMLQWFFRFNRKKSHLTLLSKSNFTKYASLLTEEQAQLERQIYLTVQESYPFTEALD